MPICDAFARIEEQPDIYDVVHVKYSDEVLTGYDHVFEIVNILVSLIILVRVSVFCEMAFF